MIGKYRVTRLRVGSLVAAGALMIGVAACGSDDDSGGAAASSSTSGAGQSTAPTSGGGSSTTTATDGTCPKTGGTVTMGKLATSTPTGFDPTLALGETIAGSEFSAIWDTLMILDTDTNTYVPNVAKSLTVGADGKTWTLVLRPDVKFTNGDVLTADIVRQNFERFVADASKASDKTQLKFVTNITVVDPQTLTFQTDKPAVVPQMLAGEAGMMVNPKFFGDPDTLNAAPPVGSNLGPFIFSEWLDGEQTTLKKNPDYWGGEVCLDELKFTYVKSPDALVDSYKLNEVDLAQLRNATEAIADLKADGAKGFSVTPGGTRALVLNSREGRPLHDERLRQAIAMAVDYKVLRDRINGGSGEASSSMYPESSAFYAGPGIKYDPVAAKALVDQVKADGGSVKLLFLVADRADWAEGSIALVAMFKDIGLDVTTQTVTTAELTDHLYTKLDYDIASWAYTARTDVPAVYLGNILRNAGITDNAEMNAAVDALWSATSAEETVKLLKPVQELWNKLQPEVPITHDEMFAGIHDNVGGVAFTNDAKLLFTHAYLK